jgi:hypothetical protein
MIPIDWSSRKRVEVRMGRGNWQGIGIDISRLCWQRWYIFSSHNFQSNNLGHENGIFREQLTAGRGEDCSTRAMSVCIHPSASSSCNE